jgi:hypothetical protein
VFGWGAPGSAPGAAPATGSSSIVHYRVALNGRYSGHGITKVSCVRSLPDGESETYFAQGSASEATKFRTTTAGSATFISHAGPEPELVVDRETQLSLHDTRSNVAPDGCTPAPSNSEPPPPATGCGSRTTRARGFLGVDRRRGSTALRVDVGLLSFRRRELLGAFSDPFRARASDIYPRCLMPDGQQWVTSLSECSTTTMRPALRQHRLFSGGSKIVLTQTTDGRGAKTDSSGNPVRANGPRVRFACGDAAASSYTMTYRLTLTRVRASAG